MLLVGTYSLAILFLEFLHSIRGAPPTPSDNSSRCYTHDGNFYPYFSTRTAYESVHAEIFRANTSCSPAQIWMLARHGARYPDQDVLVRMLDVVQMRNRIIESYESGVGRLCDNEVDELRNWRLNPKFHVGSAQLLAPQGKENLRLLAQRLRKNFPELLANDDSNSTDYVFRATNTQRTQASMDAFAHGFFGVMDDVGHAVPEQHDTLLLAHKNCPAWIESYTKEKVNAQRDEFTAGPQVKAVIDNVSERLGFAVNFDMVKNMYDMCRYETSWHLRQPSTWCRLFTNEELKVMEYREDLDLYYFAGPGRNINVQLGCRTLDDMFTNFDELVARNFSGQPKGIFYFAHTNTVQALMSALQINNENEPLLASSYDESHDRKFRTSLMGPFGTNIIAVFYECSDNSTSSHKVSFHVAEKMIKLPGCQDVLCDYDYLKEKFDLDIKQCSADFCNETKNQKDAVSSASGLCQHLIFIVSVMVLFRSENILRT